MHVLQYAADLRVGKDVSRKNHREEVRKTLQLLGLYDVRKTRTYHFGTIKISIN